MPYFDAVLLANHGALSYGESLLNAYHKMESVEFYAQLMFLSMQLGGPKVLNDKQVEKLYEIRQKFNVQGRHPSQLYAEGKTELLNELMNGKN